MSLDKKEALLNAAESLFAEEGFVGASTRDIAQRAGVNLGMLTYYFGNKDGVFREVVTRNIKVYDAVFALKLELPTDYWNKLFAISDAYTDKIVENPHFFRMIHREMSMNHLSPDLKTYVLSVIKYNQTFILELLEKGMAAGIFRKVDIHGTVSSFIGTLYMCVNSCYVTEQLLPGSTTEDCRFVPEFKERVKLHLRDWLYHFLKNL